jgi:hypothetical protein
MTGQPTDLGDHEQPAEGTKRTTICVHGYSPATCNDFRMIDAPVVTVDQPTDTTPDEHDDKCESEFIYGPMLDSPCGCADRAELSPTKKGTNQ